MRVAVLADVHGNLPALEAVLEDVDRAGVDLIVLAGDVAAGPLPGETIEALQGLGPRVVGVRGNADRCMVEAFDAGVDAEPEGAHEDDVELGRRLSRAHRDWLAAAPLTRTVDVDALGPVLVCHATPRDDTEVVLEGTDDAAVAVALDGVGEAVVVCGHTHMPFDRTVAGRRLVNPGSVGMPYGAPGAYWALLGPDVELRRTDYDLDAAAERIVERSEWSKAAAFARDNVLRPPSAAEATAAFTPLAVRRP